MNKIEMWRFFVASSVLAVIFSAVLTGDMSYAAQTNAKITGEITVNSAQPLNPRSNSVSFIVSGEETTPVSSGDYVEFCAQNLPGISGVSDILAHDGVVIGKLSVNNTVNPYNTQVNGSIAERENLTTNPGGYSRCYRVTYNDSAEKYDNIKWSISTTGAIQLVLAENGYNIESKITVGDTVSVSQEIGVAAFARTSTNSSLARLWGMSWRNNSGVVRSSVSWLRIQSSACRVAAGSIITYDFSKSSIAFDNPKKVGDIVELKLDNAVFKDTPVNEYGVFVLPDTESSKVRAKVVESSSAMLVIEIIDEIPENSIYVFDGGAMTVVDNSILKDGKNELSFKHDTSIVGDGCADTRTVDSGYNYSGSRIDSSTTPAIRSSVIVKYVDVDGNEIAASEKIKDNALFGEEYAVAPKEIDGYVFVEATADSAPLSGAVTASDQVIILRYNPIENKLAEENIDDGGAFEDDSNLGASGEKEESQNETKDESVADDGVVVEPAVVDVSVVDDSAVKPLVLVAPHTGFRSEDDSTLKVVAIIAVILVVVSGILFASKKKSDK